MTACVVCNAEATSGLCESCGLSYDRSSNADGGTVMEAMRWAADRARRLHGSTRKSGGGVSIFFDADELVMLHDRVLSGWEQSEEPGWEELLSKVERARRLATGDGG